jgi:hypothetical protein
LKKLKNEKDSLNIVENKDVLLNFMLENGIHSTSSMDKKSGFYMAEMLGNSVMCGYL